MVQLLFIQDGDLLVGDLDAASIGGGVEHRCVHDESAGCGCCPKSFDDDLVGFQGSSAPVCSCAADRGNSRCWILFHLEVPGGRWQTVMSSPASAAKAASSVFHSRSRDPLEPPESAVISSCPIRDSDGADRGPPAADRFHGELAVSASVPTLSPPRVGGNIVDPVGSHLAQLLVGEVPHRRGSSQPAAYSFLVSTLDHRVPSSWNRWYSGITKLRIPIRCWAPSSVFVGLQHQPV